MEPKYLRRKESDRTGHKKSPAAAAAARHDEIAEVEEEEKKAAEERADGGGADDADDEGDGRKPAAVESSDDCGNASECDDGEQQEEAVARLAAAIQRAEERLEARTPSPVIYQGAPVALARSPTTLLPPTHPSYTGDITPSHPLVSGVVDVIFIRFACWVPTTTEGRRRGDMLWFVTSLASFSQSSIKLT